MTTPPNATEAIRQIVDHWGDLTLFYTDSAISLGKKDATKDSVEGDYLYCNTGTRCAGVNTYFLGFNARPSAKIPLTLERIKHALNEAKQKFNDMPHVIVCSALDPLNEEENKAIQYITDLTMENDAKTPMYDIDRMRVMYLKDISELLSKNFLKNGATPPKIFRPKSVSEYAQFEHVCAVGFENNYAATDVGEIHMNMKNDDTYVRLVASVEIDGIPTEVACGSVITRGEGYAVVNEMATMPEARRKGYASEVMKALVKIAAETFGSHTILLSATQQGEPTWRSMGFVPLPGFVWMNTYEH